MAFKRSLTHGQSPYSAPCQVHFGAFVRWVYRVSLFYYKNRSLIPLSYFTYSSTFLLHFLERVRTTPQCIPFMLWVLCCFMVLCLELPQYSTLALDHETNEKSKMTSSKRKWFMLWRETWEDTPPRTLGALFSLQATAGFAHFKITSQFIQFRQTASQYSKEEGKINGFFG